MLFTKPKNQIVNVLIDSFKRSDSQERFIQKIRLAITIYSKDPTRKHDSFNKSDSQEGSTRESVDYKQQQVDREVCVFSVILV